MSLRWVESSAPFLDEECLVEALEALGDRYQVHSAEGVATRMVVAVTPAEITLEKRHGAWVLRRTTAESHVAWERRLVAAEGTARERKIARLEETRRLAEERRLEEARRQLVEARRAALVAKAKAMGYMVQEERRGQEVQLILVRRTYS